MLQPNQQFAHFIIERKLGEGGMGEVYLARDQKLSRQVALKIISAEFADDSEKLERFHREARTAAQVSHPYVMPIFDIGVAKSEASGRDVNYIVMEYLPGVSLSTHIADTSPTLARVVRLAEKIASGLAAAHKLKIVHRDIKPDNIIIDASGDPKILDFGLAKPLDPVLFGDEKEGADTMSQELTRVGKIMGTVSYMSPEQVRGEPVDIRSDIFAFGILLYRMATGDLPFAGPTQVESMAKILESSYESPRLKNQSIPSELERIIDKCLQKDREDRYQDTRDLVVDLRNLRRQFDSGVTDTISSLDVPRSSSITKTIKIPGAAAAAVVVTIVAIWLFPDLFSGGESASGELKAQTNSLAIIGFENKTGDSELEWLETGLPEILLTDLSQSQDLQLIGRQRIIDCFDVEKKTSHTYQECVDVAGTLGASRLLSGTFYKVGDKIRIDARLIEVATGNIILAQKVMGEDPFILVDSLTNKIAAALGLGQMEEVSIFASSSPEAYRQYHAGMELFWSGELDSSINKFSQAIAIDSTFALPYMRIGMAHIFQGRQPEGAQFFALAQQYEDRLPVRERDMLDAYNDTWITQNFDDAFTKLSTLLRNYPGDAELRTIYALFVNVFQRDTAVAFAHLDTVLATYPNYPFALEQFASLQAQHNNYAESIKYALRLVEILPDVVGPRAQLARIYDVAGERDKAKQISLELHEQFPDDPAPLNRLIRLSTFDREFGRAKGYVDKLRKQKPDDLRNLVASARQNALLAIWEGKFITAQRHYGEAVKHAMSTGDSALVNAQLQSMGTYYLRYHMTDSALYYSEKAHQWANEFNLIAYPLNLVGADPANREKAEPIFKEAIQVFRARLPQDYWAVPEAIEGLFEAFASADTAAIIQTHVDLDEASTDAGHGNLREAGLYSVRFGRYAEGKEMVERFVSGDNETSNPWHYMICTYYLGVANENLGNTEEAVANYREFLGLWGTPEIELEEIADARARLARLTS